MARRFTGRKVAFAVVGCALALSLAAFAFLLVKYDRGEDANNEDDVLALAEKAEADANPLLAAQCWQRLTSLDPFNREYSQRYFHALLRTYDLSAIYSFTNGLEDSFAATPEEEQFLDDIGCGIAMLAAHSNELALAHLETATNFSYYAAAPFLIDCEIRLGRYKDALDCARAYIRRFPRHAIVLHTAEWCALADRPDLIEETRRAIPVESGYDWMLLDCYCEALAAWLKGDWETIADSMRKIGTGAIDTPVFRLMRLESAAMGNDAGSVENAYRDLYVIPRMFDFHERGNAAVKHFIAEHFPDKLPLERLGRLADLVLRDGHDDIELLRIALLAQLESGTLTERNLSLAEHRFPGDKGLKTIREAYDKSRVQNPAN